MVALFSLPGRTATDVTPPEKPPKDRVGGSFESSCREWRKSRRAGRDWCKINLALPRPEVQGAGAQSCEAEKAKLGHNPTAMSDRNQISEQGALAGSPRRNGVLNARQQKFVLEYQIDQVATQAAIRAGYSAGTAHVQGSRLLSNVKIRKAIDKAQAKAAGNAQHH